MKQKVVAERYAEALFSLAREQRQEGKFGGILEDIVKISKEHPDFNRILSHPVISRDSKKEMLKKLFEGQIPQEMLSFLFLLVDKKRENYLAEIAEVYQALLNAYNQTVMAEITAAIPMLKKTQTLLKKELEDYLGQKVEIDYKTNPALLGGVTIKIGDRMIDGSLKTQLNQMAQTLVSKS